MPPKRSGATQAEQSDAWAEAPLSPAPSPFHASLASLWDAWDARTGTVLACSATEKRGQKLLHPELVTYRIG